MFAFRLSHRYRGDRRRRKFSIILAETQLLGYVA